jgi:hypothetical protein
MSSSSLPRGVIAVADGFWNIRGSYKVRGLLEIGTQASLVRRKTGKYLLLDACGLSEPVAAWLDAQTESGAALEAVLHLHPFHTMAVQALHERYPKAKQYGTERHASRFPELPWQPESTERADLHEALADEFRFSVPRGVAFVPDNPNLHFASVLALHRASKTLHVDDTLVCLKLPPPVSWFKRELFTLHPTLDKVLEPRAGAASDFREWTKELIELAREAQQLCLAHARVLKNDSGDEPIAARVEAAVLAAEKKLARHEQQYG